jgi:hypothetical protein
MAEPAIKGAGISVGVADYKDRKLCQCPAAAASAGEVASALDAKLVRRVRVITNPPDFDALFGEITKTARDAKGGTFFFYFAGHALRRGDDLLLAVTHSEHEGSKGCVPLSDVLDIVRRAQVQSSLVILNVDHPPSAAKSPSLGEGVTVIGSSRSYDARTADVRFKEYAGAVVAALRAPALELEPYLEDGLLNADGLARYLADKAPKAVKSEVFATSRERLVLRNIAEGLAAEKAAAEKAAAEKAAAEKAAAEKAAAEKAAAEKAAAEKAAAEKAAAEKAAAEKAAAEKEPAEKEPAEEAPEKAPAEKKTSEKATARKKAAKKAAKKAIVSAEKRPPDEAPALAHPPPPPNIAYYIAAVLVIGALVYYVVFRS